MSTTRRDFLKLLRLAVASTALVACEPSNSEEKQRSYEPTPRVQDGHEIVGDSQTNHYMTFLQGFLSREDLEIISRKHPGSLLLKGNERLPNVLTFRQDFGWNPKNGEGKPANFGNLTYEAIRNAFIEENKYEPSPKQLMDFAENQAIVFAPVIPPNVMPDYNRQDAPREFESFLNLYGINPNDMHDYSAAVYLNAAQILDPNNSLNYWEPNLSMTIPGRDFTPRERYLLGNGSCTFYVVDIYSNPELLAHYFNDWSVVRNEQNPAQ